MIDRAEREHLLTFMVEWLKPIARSHNTAMAEDGENLTGHRALLATIVLSSIVSDYNGGCSNIELDEDFINSTKFGIYLSLLGFKFPSKAVRKVLLG